jgi:hypothetical protein
MKLVALFLAIYLFSTTAFGASTTLPDGTVCDWSRAIHNSDGTVTYPADLHVCVGKVVQDDATKTQQVADLNKAIDLYKVTIQTDEQRIQNWIATSVNLENHVATIDDLQKKNQWLYFGLGVAATVAAAYTANKVAGH